MISGFGIPGSTIEGFPSSPPEGADNANCIVILGTK